MQDAEIYRELKEIFDDLFPDQNVQVGPELSAEQVELWDSAQNLNLIVAVEDVFQVKFHAREIESFKCLGDMVGSIKSKVTEN